MNSEQFQEVVLQQLQTLAEGQAQLVSQVADLGSRVAGLDLRVAGLDSRVSSFEARLGAVEKGQLRLETRIESEVVEKIRALFDAREVSNDRFDRIENKLDSIAADLGRLVLWASEPKRVSR